MKTNVAPFVMVNRCFCPKKKEICPKKKFTDMSV
jgi:hypothetical protein